MSLMTSCEGRKIAIKVAMIGCGAVGSIHARQLIAEPGVEMVSVFGPERERTLEFASSHKIRRVSDTMEEAVSVADAAIICSPSALHYGQARECLQLGVHTLVELPPCEGADEAEELAQLAEKRGVQLGCTHTSRYLVPYARISDAIREGDLGTIQEVNYIRHYKLRDRGWADDALLHHAAHPIDLLLDWFGDLTPRGCVALPAVHNAQTVSLLGRLPNGAPVTISVTYASRLPRAQMLIVGDQHAVETDGFTHVRSDLEHMRFDTPEQLTYEWAIHDQDLAFLRACQGERTGVGWRETVKLIRTLNCFQQQGSH